LDSTLIGSVEGAGVSSQLEGLTDGQKGVSDSLNFDLMSMTIKASPDPSSVRCDGEVTDEGICGLEYWVDFDAGCVTTPAVPVFFTSPGSRRHDSRVNGLPRKDDITRELNFGGK